MVIRGAAEMDAQNSGNPEEFYNMLQSSFNRGAAVASSSASSSRQVGPSGAGVNPMYDYGMIPPPPPEYQQQQWPQQQQQQPQQYAGSDLDFPPSLATAQRYQPTPSAGMYAPPASLPSDYFGAEATNAADGQPLYDGAAAYGMGGVQQPQHYPAHHPQLQQTPDLWQQQLNPHHPSTSPYPPTTTSAQSSTVTKVKTEASNGYVEDALTVMESHANGGGMHSLPLPPPPPHPGQSSSPSLNPAAMSLQQFSPASALGPPPPPLSPADVKPLDQKPADIGKGSKGKKATKAAAATAATVTSSAAAVAAAAGNGGVGNRGGAAGGRGKGRVKPEDTLAPEVRAAKDKERRFSNNTRERMRIRDINEALNELGRICANLNPPKTKEEANAKPCTKLAILNSAVDIITNLEKKVREKNLNPTALCAPGGPGFASSTASSASSPPPNMNVGANGNIMPSSYS